VHANGQCFHCDVAPPQYKNVHNFTLPDLDKHRFQLNNMLPTDVRLTSLRLAPDPDFHAIVHSTRKRYSYRFTTNSIQSPFDRFHQAHVYWRPFNLTLLNETLKLFEGSNDFRAFAGQIARKEKEKNATVDTVRTVYSVELLEEGPQNYIINFHLKGALYKMIRNIVGTSMAVARGQMQFSEVVNLLKEGTRCNNKAKPADPRGLCLERVFYDSYESYDDDDSEVAPPAAPPAPKSTPTPPPEEPLIPAIDPFPITSQSTLDSVTSASLGFNKVLLQVASHCTTSIGKRFILPHPPSSPPLLSEVCSNYEQLREITSLMYRPKPAPFPLTSLQSVALLETINKDVFEHESLMTILSDLKCLARVHDFFGANNFKYPATLNIIDRISPLPSLTHLIESSFTPEGALCTKKYPELASLRKSISEQKASIQSTVSKLISSLASTDNIRVYQHESSPRYTIAVPAALTHKVGILHGRSRTDMSSYVEPFAVIQPTNELRALEDELRSEEGMILRTITHEVIKEKDALMAGLLAVGQLDAVLAKYLYGESIHGSIPDVFSDGVIRIVQGRHPLLPLADAVPNSLDLDDKHQCLILSGPNAGGKTLVLKMLGLFSLMTRASLPLPCAQGSRVDLFDTVVADIGDSQSVGDVSTYTSKLLVFKSILSHLSQVNAANGRSSSLVLFDEMGSGTDPEQGVALSTSVLEALSSFSSSRIAATTHYTKIKNLGETKPNFRVAAMEFIRGKPSYKLILDEMGASYAIAVASNLQLPKHIIERATELLSDETRAATGLAVKLEKQQAELETQIDNNTKEKESLRKRLLALQEETEKLEKAKLNVRRNEGRKFARLLDEKEATLEGLLTTMKNETKRGRNTFKVVGETWDEVQLVKREVLSQGTAASLSTREGEKDVVSGVEGLDEESTEPLPPDYDPPSSTELLVALESSVFHNELGIVEKCNAKNVLLRFGVFTEWIKRRDLRIFKKGCSPSEKEKQAVKAARTISKRSLDDMGEPVKVKHVQKKKNNKKSEMFAKPSRSVSNTVDLRGFADSMDTVLSLPDHFSRALQKSQKSVYLHHGHGSTGVLKKNVREFLSTEKRKKDGFVEDYGEAAAEDGGDAYTFVTLRCL
jgi:DNA mismatch repair protein MutS2